MVETFYKPSQCFYIQNLIYFEKFQIKIIVKFQVPPFLKKCTTGDIQHDSFKYCWQVQDCYGFENISVTLGVENMKLLFCCDCDKGPVGYQDLDTKLCYVGISTVAHVQWIFKKKYVKQILCSKTLIDHSLSLSLRRDDHSDVVKFWDKNLKGIRKLSPQYDSQYSHNYRYHIR